MTSGRNKMAGVGHIFRVMGKLTAKKDIRTFKSRILTRNLAALNYPIPFRVSYPDESSFESCPGEDPVFTIRFNHWKAVSETMKNPSVGFGESYMHGDVDIEGSLEACIRMGFALMDNGFHATWREKLKFLVTYHMHRNTMEGSRRNIAAHYDLGNDFYSAWLDRDHMQYTCAYFTREDNTLEEAQTNKLELVCRKLKLQPGETVVEAGCGWGGLARYMVKNYGVKARCYNISEQQVAYARQKAAEEGIGPDQLEYVLADWRTIGQNGETYDKFVSVGMFEHTGRENYQKFFELIKKVTRPDGLALVHTIGKVRPIPTDPWLEKYIFPGAYMPSLAEILHPLENTHSHMHAIDVENLRRHYAKTLDCWAERLEAGADRFREEHGEEFVRMFLFYLRASSGGFREGGIMLYQLVLSPTYNPESDLTREHMLLTDFKPGRNRKKAAAGGRGSNGRGARGNGNGRSARNGNGATTTRRKKKKAGAR